MKARVLGARAVEVLVLNRPGLRPGPLRRVDARARGQIIQEVDDVAPEAFNDDRIGRALDEISPRLTGTGPARRPNRPRRARSAPPRRHPPGLHGDF